MAGECSRPPCDCHSVRRTDLYGCVVDSVNVSVFEYVPVRSGSLAAIGCVNVIVDVACDTGPDQLFGAMATCSGCGSVNAPLARWPGSDTLSAASPAVETMSAVVCAV